MVKGTKRAGQEEEKGCFSTKLGFPTLQLLQFKSLCGLLITKHCNRSLQTDPDTFKNLINYKEGSGSKCTRTIDSRE